ncbi:hypothetical protein KUCAC02_026613, partial [Chaenocephalus aceratus]
AAAGRQSDPGLQHRRRDRPGPRQNPFSDDKADKGIYVTRITPGGPARNSRPEDGRQNNAGSLWRRAVKNSMGGYQRQ